MRISISTKNCVTYGTLSRTGHLLFSTGLEKIRKMVYNWFWYQKNSINSTSYLGEALVPKFIENDTIRKNIPSRTGHLRCPIP